MMKHFLLLTTFGLFCITFLLQGCATQALGVNESIPHVYASTVCTVAPPGTNPDQEGLCSEVRLELPEYPKAPWLNDLLADALIEPFFSEFETSTLPEKIAYPKRVDRLAASFKEETVSYTGKLTQTGQTQHWAQFAFESYLLSSGAAHGIPSLSMVVVDTSTHTLQSLSSILVSEDKMLLLSERLKEAYRVWLKRSTSLNDAEINQWAEHNYDGSRLPNETFPVAQNWQFSSGGLSFVYGTYAIAPYSFGFPKLDVPKSELQDIIRADILNAIPE
ncbi:MAG: RsiV family protein [Burkholderiales bacterium]|jgi:hypothetical protein|nr:RsiV family protein [Burkholderiales bacterium]